MPARLSVLPQAPRGFNPRDFRLDVESIGRAGTAPIRAANAVEEFKTAQRKRAIEKATFDNRRQTAVTNARGDTTRAPFINAAATEKAEEEAFRELDVQELANLQIAEDIKQFDAQAQRSAVENDSATQVARRQGAEARIGLEDIEANETEELVLRQQERRTATQRAEALELEAERKAAELGGVVVQVNREGPDGQLIQDKGIRMPDGTVRPISETETIDATTRQQRTQQADLAQQSTRALINQRTTPRVSTRGVSGEFGGTTQMFRTITDPTTGEVTEQFIPVPNSFGSGFGEVGVETPEEFFDPDAGVGTEALDTDGNPFIPTGEAGIAFVNGEEVVYEPGRIGRDANGTRMRFTGGNPGDSRNWQTLPGQ